MVVARIGIRSLIIPILVVHLLIQNDFKVITNYNWNDQIEKFVYFLVGSWLNAFGSQSGSVYKKN